MRGNEQQQKKSVHPCHAHLQTVEQLGEALDTLSDLQVETNPRKNTKINGNVDAVPFLQEDSADLRKQGLRIPPPPSSSGAIQHICAAITPPHGRLAPYKAALHDISKLKLEIKLKINNKK